MPRKNPNSKAPGDNNQKKITAFFKPQPSSSWSQQNNQKKITSFFQPQPSSSSGQQNPPIPSTQGVSSLYISHPNVKLQVIIMMILFFSLQPSDSKVPNISVKRKTSSPEDVPRKTVSQQNLVSSSQFLYSNQIHRFPLIVLCRHET